MSDSIRDELFALFCAASAEIQEQLNSLLDCYQKNQQQLHNIHSESKTHRRRGTIHFGLLGYLVGLGIDEQKNDKLACAVSFDQLLRSVKIGFADIKKKLAALNQVDLESVVFEQKHHENILKLIQFEVEQLNKEIEAYKVIQKNSGICDHLVDSGEQELKPLGFSYIRGLFGLKTEPERLKTIREQQQFSEEQAKISSYEQLNSNTLK